MVELYVHGVGNKFNGDGVSFSENKVAIDNNEMLTGLLMNFFFAPIKGNAYFNFCHATSLDFNPVYKLLIWYLAVSIHWDMQAKYWQGCFTRFRITPTLKVGNCL